MFLFLWFKDGLGFGGADFDHRYKNNWLFVAKWRPSSKKKAITSYMVHSVTTDKTHSAMEHIVKALGLNWPGNDQTWAGPIL